jgi:hypothetical protein
VLIAGVRAGADTYADACLDEEDIGMGDGGAWDAASTECLELFVAAKGRQLDIGNNEIRTHLVACPQGSTLLRGQKCQCHCRRGRGRYRRSVFSERTGRLVSDS